MQFKRHDTIKHKQFGGYMVILDQIDTTYSGGYTKKNYLCQIVLPPCYKRDKPLISKCCKDYIERDWELAKL